MTTIALYTEPDGRAWFVREADEAVCIGPATTFDERSGRAAPTYLDHDRLERALVATGADAAWAGWGFVAEQAEFVDLCDKLGIVFIGPSGDAMRRVGDKIGAKRLAEAAGVPVVPWNGGPVADLGVATSAAERLGYPLLVKPDRRWRRPRHPPGGAPGRARRRVRGGPGRGPPCAPRPDAVPRERDGTAPQRRSKTSRAGTAPFSTSAKASLTCSSRRSSRMTRVRPARCSS
jgi:hypothetical protein